MPTNSADVCFSGETERGRPTAKTSRLTRRRHPRRSPDNSLAEITPLTFQLRDVDVDAALLCDRLDRSRQIGVTQQRAQQTQRTFLGEKPLELLLQPFSALERNHHEEDVIGPRCGRDFGPFRSPARLCWSAHLSRTRRLSVLVGLCRCPGWRADSPLLLAYPALLGRLCLARAPRAHLRLIRLRLVRCLDRRTRRCDVGDESHRGRLWATACQPRGALFQFAILLGRRHDRPVCFWH